MKTWEEASDSYFTKAMVFFVEFFPRRWIDFFVQKMINSQKLRETNKTDYGRSIDVNFNIMCYMCCM